MVGCLRAIGFIVVGSQTCLLASRWLQVQLWSSETFRSFSFRKWLCFAKLGFVPRLLSSTTSVFKEKKIFPFGFSVYFELHSGGTTLSKWNILVLPSPHYVWLATPSQLPPVLTSVAKSHMPNSINSQECIEDAIPSSIFCICKSLKCNRLASIDMYCKILSKSSLIFLLWHDHQCSNAQKLNKVESRLCSGTGRRAMKSASFFSSLYRHSQEFNLIGLCPG